MSDSEAIANRVFELEFQVAHMQRIYDQLNEVVTEQAKVMDRMRRTVVNLESRLTELKDAPETPADPLDEKPPHY